jgi:hypothetical protein
LACIGPKPCSEPARVGDVVDGGGAGAAICRGAAPWGDDPETATGAAEPADESRRAWAIAGTVRDAIVTATIEATDDVHMLAFAMTPSFSGTRLIQ